MYQTEGQGFEPWNGFPRLRFSRPVHSAALPPLLHKIYFQGFSLICQVGFGNFYHSSVTSAAFKP